MFPNGPWWHSRCNMCLNFFPGCGYCCSHNASILMCVCTARPYRIWSAGEGMFHRPLLKAADTPTICFAQHVQQSINMSIQLPADLKGPSISAPVLIRKIINFIFLKQIKEGQKHFQFTFPLQVCKMIQDLKLSRRWLFKISSRAICRVTLLKLLELSAILMLYGPLQKTVYNKKTLCLYTLYSSLLSLLTH